MRVLGFCTALTVLFLGTLARAQPVKKQVKTKPPSVSASVPVPTGVFGVLSVEAQPQAIVSANLEAVALLYRAAALEEMQLFAVADRIADQFAKGKLPLSGSAASAVQRYARARSTRLTEQERRALYGHVLGGTQSGVASPNQEFAGLFARFLAAVSDYERPAGPGVKQAPKVSATQVHSAARALASNLSNRSYGAPRHASALLADHMRDIVRMLSEPGVLRAHHAKDMWQLVERVSKAELGKTVQVSRQRGIAESGAALISWLGKVAQPLAASGGAPEVAASMTASRVPKAVRNLSRLLSPKHKLAGALTKQGPAQVRAVCFDKHRRLVACQVKLK